MNQLFTEEIRKKLERKHLLLDTNFLLEATESPEAFKNLIEAFIENNCCPITFPLVDFEFLKTSFQKELREKKKKFLEMIGCISLPIQKEIFSSALLFGNYYASQKIGPSLTDCCIAAMLKQHHNDLLLITRNHKDFPTPLFIRVATFVIERPKDVLVFGAYQFNTSESDNLSKYSLM